MKCLHCCFSCTSKGVDMSMEVFKKALELEDEVITIGGGEPTIHPNFWEIMGLTIGRMSCGNVPHIITNGKLTETAISLAKLAEKEAIYAELSLDQFHESIDPEVIKIFQRNKNRYEESGFQDIRTNRIVWKQGRGKKVSGALEGCACEDIFVEPDGKIWSCGCKSVSFGTVFKPDIDFSFYENIGGERCINDWKRNNNPI